MSIFGKKTLNSIKVPHYKNTAEAQAIVMPTPATVSIPMQQHMGPACDVTVAVGDTVKVGQIVGDSKLLLTAPIHASVSGTVKKIEDFITSTGAVCSTVRIESDGENTLLETIQPPAVSNHEEFVAAIRASGLVGLGGAGFPTHVKLNPKNKDSINTLVINAAECEPYITSDHRVMLDKTAEVLDGIAWIKKYIPITTVYIGVEDNKPDAIEKLRTAVQDDSSITVTPLGAKYPQGAEKVLVYETTGTVVQEGKLPSDFGIIVMNVSTVAFISAYMKTGMPLITKTITVDGSAVVQPKNVIVPIGTSYQEIFDFCGGFKTQPRKIIMGGPMMGITIYDLSSPLLKNNNALLAFDATEAQRTQETACIRCGRCVRACPFNLMPAGIERAFIAENAEGLRVLKVNLCMECGCCSYVCPAKRRLVSTNKMAKKLLREIESRGE